MLVKDVVEISDEDYEWFEDENGHWYYKEKANPNSEWKLWEGGGQNEAEASDVVTEDVRYKEPVTYCKNMDWNKLNEKAQTLNPDCHLLKIDLDDHLLAILEVASENKKLVKKKRVEVYPNINEKKMNKLLSKNKYKNKDLISYEDILMFADDTFGLGFYASRSGKKGIMVTKIGIFSSILASWGGVGFLPWRIENTRVVGFMDEKEFLSRKIVAILDNGESIDLFSSSDPDLKKNLEHISTYLTFFADAAHKLYCSENDLKFTSRLETMQKTLSLIDSSPYSEIDSDFDSSLAMGGDCPNCGGFMRDASLAARGGKALLRGFAKLDRSMVSKSSNPNLRSVFGRGGGWFDKKTADKTRVCDSCSYKE